MSTRLTHLEQHSYLDDVRRDIQDIPGFAKFVARRVRNIDIAEISENIAVHFPLAVVGWALGKRYGFSSADNLC